MWLPGTPQAKAVRGDRQCRLVAVQVLVRRLGHLLQYAIRKEAGTGKSHANRVECAGSSGMDLRKNVNAALVKGNVLLPNRQRVLAKALLPPLLVTELRQ